MKNETALAMADLEREKHQQQFQLDCGVRVQWSDIHSRRSDASQFAGIFLVVFGNAVRVEATCGIDRSRCCHVYSRLRSARSVHLAARGGRGSSVERGG